MANHHLHLLVTVLFAATILASTSSASANLLPTATPPTKAAPTVANSSTPTAYEILEKYNLTRGILPEGVTGYVLRPDGSFEVYLPGDCNIYVANMQILYSSHIAGNIQVQSIRDLEGVKVKMVLVWMSISEVTRTDDQLNFFAGPVTKSFPIDKFSDSFHCN